MGAPSFDPIAPDCPEVTDYDRGHARTYLRLLDAEANGATWEAIAAEVLGQDIGTAPAATHLMVESHLQRARWLRDSGYLRLLGE